MLKTIERGPRLRIFRIPHQDPRHPLPGKDVVGSKAHYLMRMARRGLPVPQGFVLPTELCRAYLKSGRDALLGLDAVLGEELEALGEHVGRRFGDGKRPLLVSVRSGAPVSMPGMMETVLNVGLNAETMGGLLRMTGNPRLVQDCRRRLVSQYGEVVHGIAPAAFTSRQQTLLAEQAAPDCSDLDSEGLRVLADAFEEVFEAQVGHAFPSDPVTQLAGAIEAVLASWSSARAQSYRKLNGIAEDLGTAVVVQAMAFGNLGPASGAGVGFTRNPSDGSPQIFGDFVANAQGEDVVAGRRRAEDLEGLSQRAPSAYRQLVDACAELESEFGDMQDFEFTVEEGQLLMLQCRPGKRTPLAAIRIAHDLILEQRLAPAQGLALLEGIDLDTIKDERLEVPADAAPIARGTSAGVGVAVGAAVFDPARVGEVRAKAGTAILICRTAETSDIAAVAEAAALVTAEGARTSHAAVVARQLDKPCIVGVERLVIDEGRRSGAFGAIQITEGDRLSIDCAKAAVYAGSYPVHVSRPDDLIANLKAWRGGAAQPGTSPRKPRRARGG